MVVIKKTGQYQTYYEEWVLLPSNQKNWLNNTWRRLSPEPAAPVPTAPVPAGEHDGTAHDGPADDAANAAAADDAAADDAASAKSVLWWNGDGRGEQQWSKHGTEFLIGRGRQNVYRW